MSKHTPWHAAFGPGIVHINNEAEGRSQHVASLNMADHVAGRETLAAVHDRARLIAAAPDMWAALQSMVGHYVELAESGDAGFWDPNTEPEVVAARAAIAKAEPPA